MLFHIISTPFLGNFSQLTPYLGNIMVTHIPFLFFPFFFGVGSGNGVRILLPHPRRGGGGHFHIMYILGSIVSRDGQAEDKAKDKAGQSRSRPRIAR